MPTVRVDDEVWKYVNVRRDAGQSMNDVLRDELGLDDDRDADPVADLNIKESKADAVRAMAEYVREEGETTPKALKQDVFPEHPATYEGSGPDYWHRQLGDHLEAIDGVERPSQRRWVWTG